MFGMGRPAGFEWIAKELDEVQNSYSPGAGPKNRKGVPDKKYAKKDYEKDRFNKKHDVGPCYAALKRDTKSECVDKILGFAKETRKTLLNQECEELEEDANGDPLPGYERRRRLEGDGGDAGDDAKDGEDDDESNCWLNDEYTEAGSIWQAVLDEFDSDTTCMDVLTECLTADLDKSSMDLGQTICDAETAATLTLCRASATTTVTRKIWWGAPVDLAEPEEYEDEERATHVLDALPGSQDCQAAYNACEEPWYVELDGCPQALQVCGVPHNMDYTRTRWP